MLQHVYLNSILIMTNFEKYMELSLSERQLHLELGQDCIERGGNSTHFKGILSNYLGITIPRGSNVLLCHRCNNSKCSNIHHMYFGTSKENMDDQLNNGYKTIWERMVEKYGEDKAREIQGKGNKSAGGKANKGKPKSFEHRLRIKRKLEKKEFDFVKVQIEDGGETYIEDIYEDISSHSWDGMGEEPLKNITCPEEFDRAVNENRYVGFYVRASDTRNANEHMGKAFNVKIIWPEGVERDISMEIHGGIGMVDNRGIWKEHEVKLAINY